LKRFAFRLERVLELRQAAEKERARELAQALNEEEAGREALRQGVARLAEARTQLSGTTGAGPRAGTLRNLELSVIVLSRQAEELQASHERCLERLEAERQHYEQSRRDRRVLERLREQRREAWAGEYQRWEQAISDETALGRARLERGGPV
jgi:flagellar export protein FliJ